MSPTLARLLLAQTPPHDDKSSDNSSVGKCLRIAGSLVCCLATIATYPTLTFSIWYSLSQQTNRYTLTHIDTHTHIHSLTHIHSHTHTHTHLKPIHLNSKQKMNTHTHTHTQLNQRFTDYKTKCFSSVVHGGMG